MRVPLVKIGKSRGIRIPQRVIEQCGFGDVVGLRLEQDRVVIAAARSPREGWREAFARAGSSARDSLPTMVPNDFDAAGWTW